jgi:hypothetical protein
MIIHIPDQRQRMNHARPSKTKSRCYFIVAAICILVLVGLNVGRATELSRISANHANATIPTNLKMKKPRLILHIGPKKTGTTYIQLSLLGKKSQVRSSLENQNITLFEKYNFRNFNRLLSSCLDKPINDTHCPNQAFWNQYRDGLIGEAISRNVTDSDLQYHTILSSVETYSRMPDNGFCRNSFGSLRTVFDVTVLIFYRRLAGWFPSEYKQRRKYLMFNSGKSQYLPYSREPLPTFSAFTREWTGYRGRDTLSSVEVFETIFGREHIKVLNYHTESIAEEFLCRGMPHSPGACKIAKGLPAGHGQKKTNNNLEFLFDEDLVISEAHRQNLLPDQAVKRRTATLALEAYWDAEPNRREQLPKSCLTSSLQDWMRNRTIFTERYLIQHYPNSIIPIGKNESRTEFDEAAATKFCEVDAQEVLQDETFRMFLSSCAFAKPNTRLSDGSMC